MMGWNGGMMSGFGFGVGLIGWFVQLLLFLALIYLAVMLIKKTNHRSDADHRGMAILKERFARGEITEDEYKRMKKIIED